MPIANCIVSGFELPQFDYELLINEWATKIPVSPHDVTISFIRSSQYGHKYKLLVNLYLPTVWKEKDVEKIQLTLLEVLVKYLSLRKDEIFIMTSKILSGHVTENGEIQQW
jgi:hypothetical protein